jgi:hypothetical protein
MKSLVDFTLCAGRLATRARGSAVVCCLALACLVAGAEARAATRALVIGVDAYQHVQPLRGAVADARDVEKSLRGIGVEDLRLLLDEQASRANTLAAFEALATATRPGDTIFITLAGHGAQEPERIKGSEPDGMDAVFLLPSFDPKDPDGASEKILATEFNHFIRKIEAAGGRVVFVADSCSGGGLAREVDPRGAEMVYRTVRYEPIKDHLVSVADREDAFASMNDFHRSIFLAAVDKKSRVAELKIAGAGYRGALSYAFSRALEGAADVDGDGKITADEIFAYVRQVAHQLSDQRQVVVLERPAQQDPRQYVVAELTRGIAVRPFAAAVSAGDGLVISSADPDQDYISPSPGAAAPIAATPPSPPAVALVASRPGPNRMPPGAMIRVASLDGQNAALVAMAQQAQVALVAPNANPDLVWDPRTHDVLAGSDVIARNIDISDLSGVIERTLILEWLKQRVASGAQTVRLLPGDNLHAKGTHVEVEVGDLTGRYLVLFNLSGNGNVQMLYPLGSDPPQRIDPKYSVALQVREPFGADLIVAATANQRLSELERLLRQSSRRISPQKLADVLSRDESQGLRLGFVGLFTSP